MISVIFTRLANWFKLIKLKTFGVLNKGRITNPDHSLRKHLFIYSLKYKRGIKGKSNLFVIPIQREGGRDVYIFGRQSCKSPTHTKGRSHAAFIY